MPTQRTERKKKANLSIKRLLKTGGLLFVCVYVIYTLVSQQIVLSKGRRAMEDYRTKIEQAQKEGQKLKAELENVSEDEYLERMARERLGLVKSNERVFIDVTDQEQ